MAHPGLDQVKDEQERQHEARKLRELFRGRFAEKVAEQIIEDKGGLAEAVSFILNGNPDDVSSYFEENEEHLENLRKDSEHVATILENGIEATYRLFACKDCQKCWWRKVPVRKEVSMCFKCETKYDPVPREKEWGFGEFRCSCKHVFKGFGIMQRTYSKCYKCGGPVPVHHILPPLKRAGPNLKFGLRNPHNCNGVNCLNQNEFADKYEPCECIHPRSEKLPSSTPGIRIFHASERHRSTGSTVLTFLDQGSLDDGDRSVAHTLRGARVAPRLPTVHEFRT